MLPPMMAVNGPPDGEVDLDLPIPPDPAYSPHFGKSLPPQPSSPTSAPVSPGKKRVRISDSTSVRVIEDPPRADPPRVPRPAVQHKTYYQQFNSDYHSRLQADTSPQPPRAFASSPRKGEGVGKRGEGGDSGEHVPESQVKEYEREYLDEGDGAQEYTESLKSVEQLTFPEDVSSTVEPSLESRDNPFLPGGDLSREAEDLLSKATIVRDKFYLHQQRQDPSAASDPAHPSPSSHPDVADGALPNDSKHPAAAVEERIAPTAAAKAEATPDPHSRENGKASDGVTSPDGVRVVEVGEEGGKGVGSDNEGDEQDTDKAKRRNKCCVVM